MYIAYTVVSAVANIAPDTVAARPRTFALTGRSPLEFRGSVVA